MMITLTALVVIIIGTILFTVLYIISVQPASLSLRVGDKAYGLCGKIRAVAIVFETLVILGYILFVFGDTYNFTIVTDSVLVIRIVGIVFTASTLFLMFLGMLAAGKESTAPRKETTLYQGIYQHMRHPQTLGEMLAWIGISLILNSLTLLIFSVIWIPVFIGATIIEDNDLAIRFGDAYISYTKKVGMFWRKSKDVTP